MRTSTILAPLLLASLLLAGSAFAQTDAGTQVQSAAPEMKLITETRLHYDHYDPLLLNEHAIHLLHQGDDGTAEILLQRALRLDPGNRAIRHNLQLVGGDLSDTPEPPATTPSGTPPAQTGLLPEPPAPWPGK